MEDILNMRDMLNVDDRWQITTVKDYMENVVKGDSAYALCFVSNLLNGSYVVDVNSNELRGGLSGTWARGREIIDVCKILGVNTIDVDLWKPIASINTNTFTKGNDDTFIVDIVTDIYTADVENERKINAVKGLLASLIDGCTNVLNGMYVYICYGTAPQSYAQLKSVLCINDEFSYLDEYTSYWENTLEETKQLVETLINWMKGVR